MLSACAGTAAAKAIAATIKFGATRITKAAGIISKIAWAAITSARIAVTKIAIARAIILSRVAITIAIT